MKQKSMTALVSAFARAYHSEHYEVKIFDDPVARRLLSDEEYKQIAKSMAEGIRFFNPSFTGGPDEAIRWAVDHQLSPPPLGRAAFAERVLQTAVSTGAAQYLILGAGYDTFAYRQPAWANSLRIFEIDQHATAADKRRRLKAAGITPPENLVYVQADFLQENWHRALTENKSFRNDRLSVCSLLGVVYYLPVQAFEKLLSLLGGVLPVGSGMVFDYPDEKSGTDEAGERVGKQALLAGAANETMLASYSCAEMERLLGDHGFLINEHLSPSQMTEQFFSAYNAANPDNRMTAFDHVNYCLAVKR